MANENVIINEVSTNFDTVDTSLDTLNTKVTELKDNRNDWKGSSDNMTGKYNSEVTAHNQTKETLKTTQTNLEEMTEDRNGWKGKAQEYKEIGKILDLKYSELESVLPTLQDGTYTLIVDCKGVAASEFIGTPDNDNVSPFGEKIKMASSGVYFNLKPINVGSDVTDASYMFNKCYNLTSIDTSGFTNVTNATNMFSYCNSLTSIDTSGLTNVTNASSMFHSCSSLISIDTSVFTNVTNAFWMFVFCYSLKSIDTTAFTNVTDTRFMLYACENLEKIVWGDSFRPNPCGKIFSRATAFKTFIASTDSEAWIKANAETMALTDYIFSKDLTLTYAQLSNEIPKLEDGYLYNLRVDCTGVNGNSEFIGAGHESALGSTLNKAKENVLINLTLFNINPIYTNAQGMFYFCKKLIGIDTSGFTNFKTTGDMFQSCFNLKSVLWDDSFRPTSYNSMFDGASSFKTIYASAESKAWIEMMAGDMYLTNYKIVLK